jgi:long-chain acyl-CoA synthetase
MNLPALLRRSASERPEATALVTGPRAVSYREFDAEADRVARGLAAAGVGPGDRVAIAMHNVPEFAFAYFGILRAGAVAVPLNAMLTDREIARILRDAGAVAVIGAPPFGDVAGRAAAAVPEVKTVISTAAWDALGPAGEAAPDPSTGAEDLAVLAYTSGTTAEPKGVMLTHGNLLANLEQQMAMPQTTIGPDDVMLLALPLFHIYGLNVTLGLTVMNGATGILI